MLSLLAAAVLLAVPVHVEKMGFTVEVRGDAVVVTAVEPGSPAEKAKLVPGAELVRLMSPQWAFASGKPLAALSAVDLHDALTPPRGEVMLLSVKHAGRTGTLMMAREDAGPTDQTFTELLSPEVLRRLTLAQQSMYYAQLPGILARREQAAVKKRPAAELPPEALPTVWVQDGKLAGAERAAFSPDWLYFEGTLTLRCPRSQPKGARVKLDGPVPPRTHRLDEDDPTVDVELALWRVSDVVAACARKVSRLDSAQVKVFVSCEGEPKAREAVLAVPLTVTCAPPADERFRRRLSGVDFATDLLTTGGPGPRMTVFWSSLWPRPKEVTAVEVDERGAVLRRLTLVKPPADEERTTATVKLDTRRSRAVRLAAELVYADGSRERSEPVSLEVLTPDEQQARFAQQRRDGEAARALLKQLEARGDPCKDVAGTVAWLKAQPGVTKAGDDQGHTISFLVGTIPMILSCHDGY